MTDRTHARDVRAEALIEVRNGYISSYFGLLAAPKAELPIRDVCRVFRAFGVLGRTLVRGPALIWEQEVGGSNPPAPTD
jgi:hypothetical protein